MAEVLTQAQIDELMGNLMQAPAEAAAPPAEEPSEKRVRVYDLRIPKRFSKDQIRTLNIIYENYCRNLSSYLSGTLRTFCEVEVMAIEEQRYFEFFNATTDNNMLGILEMKPLAGMSMVTLNQPLVFGILERLLGGSGSSYGPDREYTEIELTLMERVVRECCGLLKDAWSNVYEIEPALVKIQADSHQAQYVSPNETVVIVLLKVKIRETEGTLGFCIPYEILEPVLEHLTTRHWFTERQLPDDDRKHTRDTLIARMSGIPVELRAVLGTSRVSLQDVLALRVGDVIKLDARVGDEMLVRSPEGDVWFTGTLGLLNRHVAVRVDEIRRDAADLRSVAGQVRSRKEDL